MVMKKASDGDSPLQQGAGKSLWTLPISLRRWRRLVVCFLEKSLGPRVFSSRRIYRRKGDVRRWTRGPHHSLARPGGGPSHGMVRSPSGPPLSLLWTLSRVGKNRNFSFCFVQFREYFLCNFSGTQKQQKTGNWHYGISLIG
jgi:hypothetical protein